MQSAFGKLIHSTALPTQTEQFLRESAPGSLTATLYSVPEASGLLSQAGRVILNAGNQSEDKAARTREFARQAERLGIDVRQFSRPSAEQRLHAKTYTSLINNVPTAFVATGNLSEGALSARPRSRSERIRQFAGSVAQDNLAFSTTDAAIVQQISQFQAAASIGAVPKSTRNVAVSGFASQAVAQRIARAQKGDRIVLSGPYLDDPLVVSSLLMAKSQGANVTVLSANPQTQYEQAASHTVGHRRAIEQLSGAGVSVLTPTADDPLLVHTKALAIVGESDQLFAIGSHNFTQAAKAGRSVDLLLMLNDPQLSQELYSTLLKTEGLQQYKTKAVKSPAKVELKLTLQGRGDLYRVTTLGDQGPNLPSMPFYPTKMDADFFEFFADKKFPSVNIYSNLYQSRTGQSAAAVPDAIKQMDRELSDPGWGYAFNNLVGQPIYSVGHGVIGSTMKSAGRMVDWALGFEAHKDRELDRDKKLVGSMKRYFGQSYRNTYGQANEGPFEQMFSNFYNIGAGAATTLAFYVGVDLPLKYFRAMLETDHAQMMLQLPREAPKTWAARTVLQAAPAIRLLTFGPAIGGALNEVIQDTTTTPQNFTTRLYDRIYKPGNVLKDPTRVAVTQEGRLTKITLGDEGLYAGSQILRKFDQIRFAGLTAPILEAINPYAVDTPHYRTYTTALNKLTETIGQPTEIVFEQRQDDPNVYRPVFKNFGVERMQKIAKRYDDLASLLPANMMYWVPPLRRMMNLEEFDPVKHMTVRDVISFEDAVLWTDRFYRQVTDSFKNPGQSVRQVLKGWSGEVQLMRQERQLIKDLGQSLQTPQFAFQPQAAADAKTNLVRLQQYGEEVLDRSNQQLETLLKDQRVVRYRQQLNQQRKLLEQSPFRLLNETATVAENKYKPFESEAKHRIAKMRKLLSTMGIALLADRVSDQFFFQPLGASLLTQVKAHQELQTEDGQVARFQFSGELSRESVLLTQLGVGAAVGFLLPDVVDLGNQPESFSHKLDPLRTFNKKMRSSERRMSRSVKDIVLETDDLQLSRQQYRGAQTRYRQLQADIQSIRHRRMGLRFNTKAAIAAGFVAGLGLKTLALGAAWMLNLVHNQENGLKPDSLDAYFSANYERLTAEGLAQAQTREDYTNLAIGHTLAQMFLKGPQQGQRVYTMATQLTTPFIQVPFLLRADAATGKANLSVGLQLMPLLGSGITPALPFAVRLSERELDKFDVGANVPGYFNALQIASVMGRGLLSALTFGNDLIYERESAYEKGMEFLGLGTALALGGGRLADSNLRGRLAARAGANHPLLKQLDDLDQHTRALRRMASGALEFSTKSIRFVYTLPVELASSTFNATAKLVNPKANLRLPGAVRAAAPYYLSLVMANLMANPEGGYVGAEFDDPLTQVGGALGAGLIMGRALDRSGAFAATKDLADDFLLRTKGLSNQEFHKLLTDWLPVVKPGHAANETLNELLGHMREIDGSMKPARYKSVSRRLMGAIAAPSLWEHAHRTAALKHMLKVSDGNFATPAQMDLPYRGMKSTGARIATAAMAMLGVRAAAFTVASLLPESALDILYKTPVLGPTLRLLSGVETSRRKGAQAPPRGLYGLADRFLRTLTFGVTGLPAATGLYSDTTDPFLNLIGPLGASFKQHRTSTYIQYASSFSDISATAYDFVRGGVSQDMLARTYGLINTGQAKDLSQAIALLRGASPRQNAAKYEAMTGYELSAVNSGAISRALSVRQFRMRHASNQRASELMLDMMKEGYATGRLGHDILPGYSLDYDGYDPLGFIANADFIMERSLIQSGKAERQSDLYAAFTRWFSSSQWKGRRLADSFNPFDLANGLGSFSNAAWIAAPMSLLLTAGTISAATETVAKLSTYVTQSELSQLIEVSKLNQGRFFSNPSRYVFTTGNLPGTNQATIFQIDKLNRYNNVYRMPVDLSDALNGQRPFDLVSNISTSYRTLHKNVGKYFTGTYLQNLQTLLNDLPAAEDKQKAKLLRTFKNSVQNEVTKIIRKQMQRQVLKGTSMTLYQAFYGGKGQVVNDGVRLYIDETKSLLGAALDEVLEEVNQLDLAPTNRYENLLRLNARLEQSESMQQIINRLSEPIRGRYNINRDRRAWMRWVDEALDGERGVPQGRLQKGAKDFSLIKSRPQIRPWTEGFLTTGIKGVKGAATLVGSWVATGRSVYELFESSMIMLGGDTQPQALRRAAGEQFVSGGLYWALSAGVAGMAAMAGLGPIGAIALGIGAMMGLDQIKAASAPVRQLEQNLVRGLGRFLSHPVESIGKMADAVGLGRIARGLGHMVATPLGMVASAVTAPVRFLLESVVAPFLQDQNLGLANDSLPVQTVKSLLLPRSSYSVFLSYEPRRSTLAGEEPFIGGNIALHYKQEQAASIQRAVSVDTSIDELTVHPLMLGSVSNKQAYFNQQQYFSGGSRVLQAFGLGNYRISNTMRLALERRQAMYNALVTAAAIQRPPEPINLSLYSFIHAASASLLRVQMHDLSRPVTQQLAENMSQIYQTIRQNFSKVEGALWKPANWLLTKADRVKSKVQFLTQPVARFQRAAQALMQTRIPGPKLNLHLPGIRLPALQMPTPDFFNLGNQSFDWAQARFNQFRQMSQPVTQRLQVWGSQLNQVISHYGSTARQQLSQVLTPKLDWAKDQWQQTKSVIKEARSFLDDVASLAQPLWQHFKAKVPGWSYLQNFQQSYADSLSSLKGATDPFDRAVARAVRFGSEAVPRLGFNIMDSLHGIPKGLPTAAFFSGLDFLSGVLADTRLKSLDQNDMYKEFQRAYQEAGTALLGFTIGGFVSALTRNPLAAIGASIFGGIVGAVAGDRLSRAAYKDQEKSPIQLYLEQSVTTAALATFMQLPKTLKSGRLLQNGLLNLGLSLVTGGLGPVTQLSVIDTISNTLTSPTRKRQISAAFRGIPQAVSDATAGLRFIATGHLDQGLISTFRQDTRSLIRDIGDANAVALGGTRLRVKGSRFALEGSYSSKYRSLTVSPATARVLGRQAQGLKVRQTDLAEARFTLLHEASHALDEQGKLTRLEIGELDQHLYSHPSTQARVNEVKSLLQRASEKSTVQLYQRYSSDFNTQLFKQVYADEVSANVRAMREYIQRHPESVDDLLKVLKRTTDFGIEDVFQSALEQMPNRATFVDPGLRYRQPQRMGRALLKDIFSAPKRFFTGFMQPVSPPRLQLNLKIQPTSRQGLDKAIEVFNTDFSDLPGPWRGLANVMAKSVGSYKMATASSNLLANTVQNLAARTVNGLEGMLNPMYRMYKGLDMRMAAGGLDLFGIVDSVFMGVDVLQGITSASTLSGLNQQIARQPALARQYRTQLTQARRDQMGASAGALVGALTGFFFRSPIYGFVLGGAAGVIAPLVGFFGLASLMADQDIENAESGQAIYDPVQSSSLYLRINRQFAAERAATLRVLNPLRRGARNVLRGINRTVGRAAKFGYKALSHAAAVGTAIATSGLALTLPVIHRTAQLLNWSAKGVGKFAMAVGRPMARQAIKAGTYLGAAGARLITGIGRPIASVLQLAAGGGLRQLGNLVQAGRYVSQSVLSFLTRPISLPRFGRYTSQLLSFAARISQQGLNQLGRAERFLGQQARQFIDHFPEMKYLADDLLGPAIRSIGQGLRTAGTVGWKVTSALAASAVDLTKSAIKAGYQTTKFAGRIASPFVRAAYAGTKALLHPVGSALSWMAQSSVKLGLSSLRGLSQGVMQSVRFGSELIDLMGRYTVHVGRRLQPYARATARVGQQILRLGWRTASFIGRDIYQYGRAVGRTFGTGLKEVGQAAALYVQQHRKLITNIGRSAFNLTSRLAVGVLQTAASSTVALWQMTQRMAGLRSVFPYLTNLATGTATTLYRTFGRPAVAGLSLVSKLGGKALQLTAKTTFQLLKLGVRGLRPGHMGRLAQAAGHIAQNVGRYALHTAHKGLRFGGQLLKATVQEGLSIIRPVLRAVGEVGPYLIPYSAHIAKTLIKTGQAYASELSRVTRHLSHGLTRSVSAAGKLISGTFRAGSTLLGRVGNLTSRVVDAGLQRLAKYTPGISRYILSQGYKETVLNALSPAIDLGTFGYGSFRVGSLNATSTYAEVEDAYIQAASAKGAIVGSVFGLVTAGALGDTAGSLVGQITGAEAIKERARLRYEARDYGVMPVLDDLVKPLFQETVLAGAAGSYVGRHASRTVAAYMAQSSARIVAGKGRRLDRILSAANQAYQRGMRGQVAQAGARFTRVLGRAPGAAQLGRLVRGSSGLLRGVAKTGARVLGPALDMGLLGYGLHQAQTARTEAEHEVATRRVSSSLGSMAGGMIGGVLGPIGAIAGAYLGNLVMDKVGGHLSKEAYSRRVSAKQITTGQVVGGGLGALVGAGLGALAVGAAVAAGTVASIAAAPLVLAAAGVGLIAGAIAGGYSMLIGRKKDKSMERLVQRARRRRGAWAQPKALNLPLKRGSIVRSQSDDEYLVRRRGQERLEVTQDYLNQPLPTDNQLVNAQHLAKESQSTHDKERQPWWKNVLQGVTGFAKQAYEFGQSAVGLIHQAQKGYMDALTTLTKRAVGAAKKVVTETLGVGEVSAEGTAAEATPLMGAASTGKSYLRLLKTDEKDEFGLNKLTLQMVGKEGQILDTMTISSGIRSRQIFRKAKDSRGGSLEPVPEGTYSLGSPEWTSGSFGAGLGPMWVSVNPTGATRETGRAAIGIHLDSNRNSGGAGTAGCLGIQNMDDLRRVDAWFKQHKPTELVVDYGLGTVPGKYKSSVSPGQSGKSGGSGPVKTVGGGVVLSEAEAYRLAALAIMESPSRLGRLDAAQAVFNRINAPKVGLARYGSNVTQVAFASGQFEPYFGVSSASIQGREGAIAILKRKRGMSHAQASQVLDQFFADAADPTKMANARKHVGGRTSFKGVSEYRNRVAGEDPLRQHGDNFYHIDNGQSYSQLSKLSSLGPAQILIKGQGASTVTPTQTTQPTARPQPSIKPAKGSAAKSAPTNRVQPTGQMARGKYSVHTQYFIDDSPPGSYDYTIEQNGNYNPALPSPVSGVITASGSYGGYGYGVAIKDQKTGMEHFFAHLHQRSIGTVKVGQTVAKGQVIGYQGTTGHSTGEHLHHEIWNKPRDEGGHQITNRSITKPIVLNFINEMRKGTQASGSSVPSAKSTITAPTIEQTQQTTLEQAPAPSQPLRVKVKRKRSQWQSSAVDLEQLKQGVQQLPMNSAKVGQLVAAARELTQKAIQQKPQPPVAIQVATAKLPMSIQSMDSSCPSPAGDCLKATQTGTRIQLNDLTQFEREWESFTGISMT